MSVNPERGMPDPELPAEALDIVEAYLDDLQRRLSLSPRATRRTLAEAEDHLFAATIAGINSGEQPAVAARAATAAFGRTSAVARSFTPSPLQSLHLLFKREVFLPLSSAVVFFTGIGLFAIGVSGLAAELLGRVFGSGFVAGDYNGITYTPQRCQDFISYFPGSTCEQAATIHHFGEVVEYRVGVGVLGLTVLFGYWLWRRRANSVAPPDLLVGTVGVALFGIAAVALAFSSLTPLMAGGPGTGAPLSAAVISAVVAVLFLPRLTRALSAT